MAPFDIVASLGKFIGYMVFLLIGLGFGAVLEMSGFGDSRKLAAQFYFKDMTVLKVMFTAIVVAMVLIFAFSALGFLDFGRLYVNPTYLFPGIIGGLIMGVGFIVGGFCPGTSIVALATFKIDGIIFAVGVAFGVFVFGETVSIFQGFHNSSYMDRFILPELFGVSTGLMVLLVVIMALVMFYWADRAEKFFGEKMPWKEIKILPANFKKIAASAVLVFFALFVLFSGQPTPEDKWNRIGEKEVKKLENRDIHIHPGELLEVMNDPMLYTTLLDIRSETDFNLFHLENARRITFENIHDSDFMKELSAAPDNTVVAVMSNNETDAQEAYKLLRGQGVLNLYILSGGINNWLGVFAPDASIAVKGEQGAGVSEESFQYIFSRAVGSTIGASNPGLEKGRELLEHSGIKFEKKVKIQKKKALSGGCA
ncbi:MAG: YeeE/YedE family protein [bacterium]|nr:YeeE/YedE family protein [bacterium]